MKRWMQAGLILILGVLLWSGCSPAAVQNVDKGPWWNEGVFYQIFVRSFYDSDGNGIGDFNGITAKLDYLNDGNPKTTDDLGVTGIWLLPIMPSPSYHGYDVTDYKSVNFDYGTMDDFNRLLEEAHKRNIRIILDLVVNHTSVQHPWFIEAQNPNSPYRDWYIWSAENPGYLGPWQQEVWHRSAQGDYYYGVFWSGMPDLNYRNPAVGAEMKEVARFWLEDVGVDGFRVDGARHLIEEGQVQVNTEASIAWFKEFTTYYKGLRPDTMSVGEVWDSSYVAARYPKSGALDMVFDFDASTGLLKAVNWKSAQPAYNVFTSNQQIGSKYLATFLTNHDMNRVMSQVQQKPERARNAATLLLTGPGTPFIYYGEEIGMTGVKPDEQLRTPMQWSSEAGAGFTTGTPWMFPNADYKTTNVANEAKDPNSLYVHYRKLIQLRMAHPALRSGTYLKVNSKNGAVYAALRVSDEEVVLILVNLGEEAVTDYALSLDSGLQPGSYVPKALLGDGKFARLTVSETGGFSEYLPEAELPAGENLVLLLTKR
jgi:glycosidase